jgi:DNA-binding CsgD family transcriptional regulator
MKQINTHNRGLQKVFGIVSSLTMLGLASSESVEPSESALALLDEVSVTSLGSFYLLIAVFFLASAFLVSLGAIQAGLLFVLSALQATRSFAGLNGLAFAVVAAIILLRRGWFYRRPMVKAVVAAGIGCAALVGPLLFLGRGLPALLPAFFGSAVYVIVVFGMARGRFLAALAPKKRVLRLSDYNLTARESRFVKMRIAGKSVRQIAEENFIAISTVRNGLSNAYHKLHIEGAEVLMAIGERYTVE